jgi:hypothetical protein
MSVSNKPLLALAIISCLMASLSAKSLAQPTATGLRVAQGGGTSKDSAAAVASSAGQAFEIAKSLNWPRAGQLRLELLQTQAQQLQGGGGDLSSFLGFFSTSRQVFWNANPPAALAAKIRELEAATQQMAKAGGVNLDLPPILASAAGSAPAQTVSSQPAVPAQTTGSWQEVRTAVTRGEQLTKSIVSDVRNQALPPQVDDLTRRARTDLEQVTSTFTNLRVALEENGDPRQRWGEFEVARIRFLVSYSHLPQLDQRLPELLSLLQTLPGRVPGGRLVPTWP